MGVVVGSIVAIAGSVVVVDDAAMTIVDVDSPTGAGVIVDGTTITIVDVSMAVMKDSGIAMDVWKVVVAMTLVVVSSLTLVVVGGVRRTLTVISSLGS